MPARFQLGPSLKKQIKDPATKFGASPTRPTYHYLAVDWIFVPEKICQYAAIVTRLPDAALLLFCANEDDQQCGGSLVVSEHLQRQYRRV